MKRAYRMLVLISFAAFALTACKKDDNGGDPGNLTNGKTTAVFNPDITYGAMTDQEGSDYKTVTIGAQTWMAENLRTTVYNDGTAIRNLNGDWIGITTGAYCNFGRTTDNDSIATFGRLYNWYAVNSAKLAPTGWHVATDAEWSTLTTYLGGLGGAGNKIKETGTTHWISNSAGASNESGFTALPGGYRGGNGGFLDLGYACGWWSATSDGGDGAWYWHINSPSSEIFRINTLRSLGLYIRCVKD